MAEPNYSTPSLCLKGYIERVEAFDKDWRMSQWK